MGRPNQPGVDVWYNLGYTRSMKTAISLPDKLFHEADSLAKLLGISRSELYAKALAAFLDRHSAEQVTARLNTVYQAVEGRVEPSLAVLQSRGTTRQDHW